MYILCGLITSFFLILDQVTKYFAVENLQNNPSIHIIGDFLRFTYVENRGAAFGMLQGQRLFFIVATVILVAFLMYYLIINKNTTTFSKYVISLILSGALGNFIDRLRLGFVIDFIDVRFGTFYNFPVFNIADCCVVVGTILMCILILTDKFEKSEIDG